MKILIFFFLAFILVEASGQDITPIVINLRDNSRLQFNGNPVKMKATVLSFSPLINTTKDITISVSIQYFESTAGAYAAYIPTTIAADGTLTADEKTALLQIYGDRVINYSTAGQWVDASGNVVPIGTGGATTELAYWQSFKLNQVAGVGTAASTGALEAMYLTITAMVNKLNTRKKW